MTTSQKAKYIFSAILSAALFLFLFFVVLFLIGAFLITLLTLIGISSESDSFNIGKLLGIALSLLYGLRDDFSFVLAYLIYIVAFFAAAFVTDRIAKKNAFLYRWTYIIAASALVCYGIYTIVMSFIADASWRYALAMLIAGFVTFYKSNHINGNI